MFIFSHIYGLPSKSWWTYTGRLLNYSNTPSHLKWNTFTNILKRCLDTFDPVFHDEFILKFKDLMKKNCYNGKYVDSFMNYVFRKNFNQRTEKSRVIYNKLPFVNGGCNVIKNYLENLDPKIKIALSNYNVLKNQIFSKLKDQAPLTKNLRVVYKISCRDCQRRNIRFSAMPWFTAMPSFV